MHVFQKLDVIVRERFKIAMLKKEVPDFPCLAKYGGMASLARAMFCFSLNNLREFSLTSFLHVSSQEDSVCQKCFTPK